MEDQFHTLNLGGAPVPRLAGTPPAGEAGEGTAAGGPGPPAAHLRQALRETEGRGEPGGLGSWCGGHRGQEGPRGHEECAGDGQTRRTREGPGWCVGTTNAPGGPQAQGVRGALGLRNGRGNALGGRAPWEDPALPRPLPAAPGGRGGARGAGPVLRRARAPASRGRGPLALRRRGGERLPHFRRALRGPRLVLRRRARARPANRRRRRGRRGCEARARAARGAGRGGCSRVAARGPVRRPPGSPHRPAAM